MSRDKDHKCIFLQRYVVWEFGEARCLTNVRGLSCFRLGLRSVLMISISRFGTFGILGPTSPQHLRCPLLNHGEIAIYRSDRFARGSSASKPLSRSGRDCSLPAATFGNFGRELLGRVMLVHVRSC